MQARCPRTFLLIFLPFLLLAIGCRSRTDLVESELRTRERMYREALQEQRKTEFHLHALQQEVDALRRGHLIPPELAVQVFGLKRIVLGRGTSGIDVDGLPGDELLQVVIEPRDVDDHTIKAPGILHVLALETSPQGIKFPLSSWDIPPETLRQNWKQGLLSTGYTLQLPWQNFPQFETVRVVARLVTSDQRVFEADKDIKVRPLAGALRRNNPLHFPPSPLDTLPAPRPLPAGENEPLLVPAGKIAPSSWSQHAAETPPGTAWQPSWRSQASSRSLILGRPVPLPADSSENRSP